VKDASDYTSQLSFAFLNGAAALLLRVMAKKLQVEILRQGVQAWNTWRAENPRVKPDLRAAKLSGTDLTGVHFEGANLSNAHLMRARLQHARFAGANLRGADLMQAWLPYADFSHCDLRDAKLQGAYLFETQLVEANLTGAALQAANFHLANLNSAVLTRVSGEHVKLTAAKLHRARLEGALLFHADLESADLSDADLSNARLQGARLLETNFERANLTGCWVYGISAWDIKLDGAIQVNLRIDSGEQPAITVDSIDVAQFIYLLLNNTRIRHVIDAITSKVVLILGRFTPERKAVLDAIREALRSRDYLPVLFDFEQPMSRDLTETIGTLAHMARFVIADITDAKSIPQELMRIVPDLPSVPVQPLLLQGQQEYGMLEHFKRFPWFLPIFYYAHQEELLSRLNEKVISPAEQAARDLLRP
jgi:uncharacterized protein YjbI with pentapeptide repeats